MTTTEDPQVWTDPEPKWHLVPPSGHCGKHIETRTVVGVELVFTCTRVLDAEMGGHLLDCAPLDSNGRDVLSDPYYQAPADVPAKPVLTDRQRAIRAAKGPKPVRPRAKVEKPAEAEKEEKG